MSSVPPPGWYSDGSGAPARRWWNGATWENLYETVANVRPTSSTAADRDFSFGESALSSPPPAEAQAVARYEEWSHPRPQKRWDGVAISGFVLTVVGALFAMSARFVVAALLLSGIGLLFSHLSTRTRYRGRGLAVAGIVIGWCVVAVAVISLLATR